MKKIIILMFLFITSFAFCYEGLEFPKTFHFEVYKDSIKQDVPFRLGMNIADVENILGKANEIKEFDEYPEGKKHYNPVRYQYDGIYFSSMKGIKKVTHIEVTNSDYSIAGGMFKIGSSLKTFLDIYGSDLIRTSETSFNGKKCLSFYYIIHNDKEKFREDAVFETSSIFVNFLFDKKTNKCVYFSLIENMN